MHALVTGITGFVGGYLAEHLVELGHQVTGIARAGTWPESLVHLTDQAELIRCDLSNSRDVSRFLEKRSFDWIFHLAGLANPRHCVDDPQLTQAANVQSVENLLSSLHDAATRFLYVSTSYVYGKPDSQPVDESCPVHPSHPYAVSKWSGEQVCMRWCEKGRDIVRVRPFNHTGPRQPLGYIVPDWVEQVVRMEHNGAVPRLRVGNIESRRDYTDVRDIARAYCSLMVLGKSGMVYNLGSGCSLSGIDILRNLKELSRVSFEIETDSTRIRTGEIDTIVADSKLMRELTGWEPVIPFHQTLADCLEYWRHLA